jgi:hypothetical protein
MRQVEDHACPGLTRRVPTICVLLSTLFSRAYQQFCNQHAVDAERNDYGVKYES